MKNAALFLVLPLFAACTPAAKVRPLSARFDPKTETMVVVSASGESDAYAVALPKRFHPDRKSIVGDQTRTEETSFRGDAGEEIMIVWHRSARADFLESAEANIDDLIRKGAPPITRGALRGALREDVFKRINPKIPFVKATNVTAELIDGKGGHLIVDYGGKRPVSDARKEVLRVLASIVY